MANKMTLADLIFEMTGVPPRYSFATHLAAERAVIKMNERDFASITPEERDALYEKFPDLKEFARVAGV